MARRRGLLALTALCLACSACRDVPKGKKPDPTKGRVTGIVFCTDTGMPARFANVVLSAYPGKDARPDDDNALPETERAVTGLDGRFQFEAVDPGRYFAFAALEGYLDPKTSIDLSRAGAKATGQERILDAIDQWKDHLVDVNVSVNLTADITLQVERGAEIQGTVTYDDGSPAIGTWPVAYRKTGAHKWIEAGASRGSALATATDGHGRYSLTNLPAGEYAVCTMLPAESDDLAPRVCLGNVFRRKDASTVKVQAGAVAAGTDIVIPLSGLHAVAGLLTTPPNSHAPDHATVRLLYADDREQARTVDLFVVDDGRFSFPYVPEGKYFLEVSSAGNAEKKVVATSPDGTTNLVPVPNSARHYADQEIPVTVDDDLGELSIPLAPLPTVPAVSTPIAPPAQP